MCAQFARVLGVSVLSAVRAVKCVCVCMYVCVFTGAKDLASKMVSLFILSKQLLSQQQHYDWGLRPLKTVLNTGGKLLQELKQAGVPLNPQLERETLIKAIRVNTLSKLTFDDAVRFLALLGDVFPGVRSEGKQHAAVVCVCPSKRCCVCVCAGLCVCVSACACVCAGLCECVYWFV